MHRPEAANVRHLSGLFPPRPGQTPTLYLAPPSPDRPQALRSEHRRMMDLSLEISREIQPTVFSANGLRPVSSEFDRGHDQVKYSILSAMPAASRRSPRSASAAYGLPVRERSADLRGDRACACHQGSYVRSVLNLRDRFDRRLGRPSSVTGAHPLARSAIHHHSDAASQSERDILTLGGKRRARTQAVRREHRGHDHPGNHQRQVHHPAVFGANGLRPSRVRGGSDLGSTSSLMSPPR